MEGFGVLELIKTLLEKQPPTAERKEEGMEESAPPSPSTKTVGFEVGETINPYVAFATAHDARARKIKK